MMLSEIIRKTQEVRIHNAIDHTPLDRWNKPIGADWINSVVKP
jgi:hypothetical protein